MAGLSWQNDNYVCHEAVCPVCKKGGAYGSGDYSVELRVYFSGGAAKSSSRPIQDMRIKCGGSCTVGTGDSGGLYLISGGKPVNWSISDTRRYLSRIGSPFASAVGGSKPGCLFWIVAIIIGLVVLGYISDQ